MIHLLRTSTACDRHQPAPIHRRRVGFMALMAAAVLPLASCADSGSVAAKVEDGEKLQVVTTFLPITNFTLAVAGDRAEVTQLLPPGVGPHDYQARPQDVQRLAEADVLVENGLEVENFLDGVVDNANNPDLILVDSSEGIEAIPMAKDGEPAEEGHDDEHEEGEHEEGEHEEDEHEEGEHEEDEHDGDAHAHDHGEFDPHIWLDPKKAMQQVGNIRDALIAADPAGEAIYTANADDYIQQLQQLDERTRVALAPYADQTFVSYHDFADHFSQSYDINVEHLVSVPEDSATPADMQRVIEAVEASDLKTLLQEPAQQGGSLASLAEEMNLQVSEFDPMESSGPEGLSADYYLETMTQNVENLEMAFAQAAR